MFEGAVLRAAFRFSEYAIATACFCGFPAFISAFTLLENASFEVDFLSGIGRGSG